jgi:hypothetical protein
MQDPGSPTNPVAYASVTWANTPDANLVAETATQIGTISVAPVYARVLLNSGTGSVSTVFRQVYAG